MSDTEYSPHEERLKTDRRIEPEESVPDERLVECHQCGGSGEDGYGQYEDFRGWRCTACNGSGSVTEDMPLINEDDLDEIPMPTEPA